MGISGLVKAEICSCGLKKEPISNSAPSCFSMVFLLLTMEILKHTIQLTFSHSSTIALGIGEVGYLIFSLFVQQIDYFSKDFFQ